MGIIGSMLQSNFVTFFYLPNKQESSRTIYRTICSSSVAVSFPSARCLCLKLVNLSFHDDNIKRVPLSISKVICWVALQTRHFEKSEEWNKWSWKTLQKLAIFKHICFRECAELPKICCSHSSQSSITRSPPSCNIQLTMAQLAAHILATCRRTLSLIHRSMSTSASLK